MIALARETGCDAVHPGYGFLAEKAAFARAVVAAGMTFVGPSPEALDLFGDKVLARELAARAGAPVIEGARADSPEEARAFFEKIGAPVMLKAVAGGGGRGMRSVRCAEEIADAFARCQSEAMNAFGDGSLYAERLIDSARHIEVQILGDRHGGLMHFGERECTIQRRNQKLVEMAPSPSLSPGLRERIVDTAMQIASAARYDSLGTFEFLLDASDDGDDAFFAFIEMNPRLQVEHPVTEEVFGFDLVQAQIRVAGGQTLAEIGLDGALAPRGFAIEARVNLEVMAPSGEASPSGGRIAAFDTPSGPGVRVDAFGYSGYRTVAAFDSLIAKLIVHSPSRNFAAAAAKAARALAEFRIEGVETNLSFLQALLSHPDFVAGRIDTRFVERRLPELLKSAAEGRRRLYFEAPAEDAPGDGAIAREGPEGAVAICAPISGALVSLDAAEGDALRPGQQIAVIEAMKMEHLVTAPSGGIVREVRGRKGDALYKDDPILFMEPTEDVSARRSPSEDGRPAGRSMERAGRGQRPRLQSGAGTQAEAVDLDAVRQDLADMLARQAFGLDENRPEAVARRRKTGQRTARENIAALVDAGSFVEYGSLAVAAQAARRTKDDLIHNTPADGVVAGLAAVNGDLFEPERARCMVVAYDYTVLAGTQGQRNHKKQDRLFALAERQRLPVVLFAEGGGGRPGDTEGIGVTGLDVPTFAQFAKLSALAPLVGIVSGRCFAGNAALLGCCDVVIATKDASVGMGGPAMIEGGGLGNYRPDEVGPVSVQAPNEVIDVLVEDEPAACAAAKKYLAYFQGRVPTWSAAGPAAAASRRPREPAASLRNPHRRRDAGRRELRARTARRLRPRNRHGFHPYRGPPVRRHRQQSETPRRRDRFRRGRQGRALHAALRRLRHSDRLALRHAGLHGRAGSGEDRARAPCLPHVRDRRRTSTFPISQLCCARATGSARRRWRAVVSTPNASRFPGRPASSAAWGWKAPFALGFAGSSPRSRTRSSAKSCSGRWWRNITRSARRPTSPRCSRSTR